MKGFSPFEPPVHLPITGARREGCEGGSKEELGRGRSNVACRPSIQKECDSRMPA